MDERIVHCLTLNSLTLNVGSLNVATSRRLKEKPIGYFKFADPEVSRIVAENWGDGTGTTLEQIEDVTDISNKFQNNTVIENFDEFGKFKNVSTLNTGFKGCSKLKRIDCSNIKEFKETWHTAGSFRDCISLEDVGNLENLQVLGNGTFTNCTSLNIDVYLPNITFLYGKSTFTSSGIKSFDAPNVETFKSSDGDGCFQDCKSLIRINLPLVSEVPTYFAANSNSLEEINIQNVKIVNDKAFAGCSSLKKVDIEWENVTQLKPNCFMGCPIEIEELNALSLIELSVSALNAAKIKKIKSLGLITQFKGWTGGDATPLGDTTTLKSVEFPETFTSFDVSGNRWMYKYNLDYCIFHSTTPPSLSQTFSGSYPIYVPDASVEAYKTATNWNQYANRIKPLSEAKNIILLARDKYIGRHFNISILYGPLYEYEKGVTWSITSGSEYASIDQEGNVTINESANNNVITVRATSIYNDTIYDDIDITVTYADSEYLYLLPEETVFNNSNYIDTGIQLMDEDIDYTIYVRGVVNAYESFRAIFHCVRESSPYPGILMDCTDRNMLRIGYGKGKSFNVPYTYGNEFELKVTHASGTNSISYSFTTNGSTTSGEKTDYEFVKLSQTLLIGAYQTIDGSKGRFLDGTISEFYIRDYVEK